MGYAGNQTGHDILTNTQLLQQLAPHVTHLKIHHLRCIRSCRLHNLPLHCLSLLTSLQLELAVANQFPAETLPASLSNLASLQRLVIQNYKEPAQHSWAPDRYGHIGGLGLHLPAKLSPLLRLYFISIDHVEFELNELASLPGLHTLRSHRSRVRVGQGSLDGLAASLVRLDFDQVLLRGCWHRLSELSCLRTFEYVDMAWLPQSSPSTCSHFSGRSASDMDFWLASL